MLFGGGLYFDDGAGQIMESAVVEVQGCGGLGVDGDDAAVHDVVLGHGAGLQHIQGHIGGVGAKLGVVDAAGSKSTGGNKAVRARVERDTGLGQRFGNGSGGSHDHVVGRGKDGVDLADQAVGSGHDLVIGVAGLFDVGDALGVEVSLGLRDRGGGVGLGVGVEQADGLGLGLDGEDHIHDGLGVQRVGSAGDVVDVGQVSGGGVRDGGVDDRGLGGFAGGGHALGGQRGDGDDGIVAVGNDLGADLVQRGGVVLAVEILVLDGDALLGGLGIKLGLNSGADLVQAGVVQLLHHGNLVSGGVGGGIRSGGGSSRAFGSGRSGGSGSTAGGQRSEHGGGGQYSNELFHGNYSLFCKMFCVLAGFTKQVAIALLK